MIFYGHEMNFPLLANGEANMVPGTGTIPGDQFLCLGGNMGRIIMKCYIPTKLQVALGEFTLENKNFLLGNKKLLCPPTRGQNLASVKLSWGC